MAKFLLKLFSVSIIILTGFLSTGPLRAQIVGSDAFMMGDYVQIGLNGCGAFASSTTPPAGYVVTGLSGLNFIADADKDGWTTGTPAYCGDYAIPGAPVEGFGIQISGINYYNTDQYCSSSSIPGSITDYYTGGDSAVLVWEGDAGGIHIIQTSTIHSGDLFFVTKVELVNTSGGDLSDVYYKRNIDPDQESLATGSTTTINTVIANPVLGDPYSIVTAEGLTYGCYLAVVANSFFSSCSWGNFGTTAGSLVSDSYNGLSGYNQSGTHTADEAVQMSFWVPSLGTDESVTIAFAYAFSEDAIEDALTATFVPSDVANDVGVIDIISPQTGCGLGSETVTIKVYNYGYAPQSDIPVKYQADGGTIYSGTIAGPVSPGSFAEYTFGTAADLSTLGDHTIDGWTALGTDADASNDHAVTTVTNVSTITTFPYHESFEGGAGSWTSGGVSSTWELGSPAGFTIIGAPPETPGSVNSWTTSLTSSYAYGENSFVESPCFDFGTLEQPSIEFDIWWETTNYNDGARLEYSLDAGASWSPVGDIATGDNWYTNTIYALAYVPAWTGSSGSWKHAAHDIAFLAGEPQVKFRFHMAATPFSAYYDGVAFDNINIQGPYLHDISLTALTAPISMPGLSTAETVIAHITNFGLSTESVFNVSYQVDGGSIITEAYTGPSLAYGESADFSFATTADFGTAATDYDVLVWTSLATDEWVFNDTLTTVVSNLFPITGDAAYYIYSNVEGGSEPWGSISNSTAMDLVFGAGEWNLDYYETLDPGTVFGLGTCFVMMEGGNAMADELEDFLAANIITIQDWVAAGGHLILNSAPNEGDGMDFGFGGVELTYGSVFTDYATATDPTHPIFNYYYLPVGADWSGTSFAHSAVSGGDIIPLINKSDDASRWVLAEKEWGAGRAIFGGLTPDNFHSPALESKNLTASIIKYQAVCTLADIDLGVIAITGPDDGCGLGAENVNVKIANYGFDDQSNIPVRFRVDGGSVVVGLYPGLIAAGEIVDYTFPIPAIFAAPGTHTVEAWTAFPGDLIIANDSAVGTVKSFSFITSYPYNESFEGGSATWIPGGSYSTWELGSPAGPVISGAPPATPGSLNSWATELDGYYNYNENSYLDGPCFDFTSLVLPYIDFDIWWATPEFNDGMRLEYSLDEGTSWTGLGAIGEGENWYNNSVNALGYDPFTGITYPGWTGSSGAWKHAYHDLSFLAGEPSVKFRFHFASQFTSFYDGVAIDNINVQDPFDNDIGVLSIDAPAAAALDFTSSEDVQVTIKNFGILPQSTFSVSFQLDGGAVVTESYSGPAIDAGATATFAFAASADLSAEGLHNLCAWTNFAIDEAHSNDTTCNDIMNLSPVSGTGAYLVYSNSTGYEPFYGSEYNNAMTDVFGSGGYVLDYYETLSPFDVFSESNCFIYLEGGGDHAKELNTFLENNITLVEAWVESGGNLLLNASPYEGGSMDWGFDGTGLYIYWYTYDGSADDPSHPIFTGPFTPAGSDYFGFNLSYGYITGDFTPLLGDDYSDNTLVAEKNWGDGTVLFGALYTPIYWSTSVEGMNMHRNMIDYLKLCAPVDVGVSDLIEPEGGCSTGTDADITIEITNYGPGDISAIPVHYQVDGGAVVDETYPGPLVSGASDTYTFTISSSAFTASGDHDVVVWSSFSGDGNASNDTYSTTITTLATPLVDLGSNQSVCDEFTIDAGNPGSTYEWSTGAETQSIVVTETGTYSVTVTNPVTGCTATDAITVTVTYSPTSSFTYSGVGLTVTFTNTSTGGASYLWDFGDGATSTEANPTHVYAETGSYTVKLTVTNACDDDLYTTSIPVFNAIEDIELADASSVYPNPTSDKSVVELHLANTSDVTFELLNVLGESMWSLKAGMIQNGAYEIDMRNFADGVYQLKIIAGDKECTKQIVLDK